MPFSPCKHHIFVSGQVVPSVLAASLPDTPERGRQAGRGLAQGGYCDRKAFGATGCMAGKDTIDKRQAGKAPGAKPTRANRLCASF